MQKKEIYPILGWLLKNEGSEVTNSLSAAGERNVRVEIEKLKEISEDFYLVPTPNPPVKVLVVDGREFCIIFGDYLDKGVLEDVVSIHYHEIEAVSSMTRKFLPLYIKTFLRNGNVHNRNL